MFNIVSYNRRLISGDPVTVKRFKHREDMHAFLNKGDNALHWKEAPAELASVKAGRYVRAGGKYHNTKSIDPTALAHILR